MTYSRIISTGSYLPAQRLSNVELVQRLSETGVETSHEWIVERTGIQARHFAQTHETCSELALNAARNALNQAQVDAQSIDLIIVATSTPDMVFPSTAAILQGKLGITNHCAAFDVQAVCSGFVYALSVADALIRTGSARRALVVGSEVFSRLIDFTDRPPAFYLVMALVQSFLKPQTRQAYMLRKCTLMASIAAFCAFRALSVVAHFWAIPTFTWMGKPYSNWQSACWPMWHNKHW